jgi:hypothetical protein
MSFFKRLTSGMSNPATAIKEIPENQHLVGLIEAWSLDNSDENFNNVINELTNSSSILFLASRQAAGQEEVWKVLETDIVLEDSIIILSDGARTLLAFTSPQRLSAWTNETNKYIAVKSSDILQSCIDNNVSRIIINNNQVCQFVLEWEPGSR